MQTLAVKPADTADAHRPLEKQHDLAAILSHVEQRPVTNDYTVRFEAQALSDRPPRHPASECAEAGCGSKSVGRHRSPCSFRDRYCAGSPAASASHAIQNARSPAAQRGTEIPRKPAIGCKNFSIRSSLLVLEAD